MPEGHIPIAARCATHHVGPGVARLGMTVDLGEEAGDDRVLEVFPAQHMAIDGHCAAADLLRQALHGELVETFVVGDRQGRTHDRFARRLASSPSRRLTG